MPNEAGGCGGPQSSREQAEMDREALMLALQGSEETLGNLEEQLRRAMAGWDAAEERALAATREQAALLEEVKSAQVALSRQTGQEEAKQFDAIMARAARSQSPLPQMYAEQVASLQETVQRQDARLEHLRNEISAYVESNTELQEELDRARQQGSELAELMAENARLKEINYSHARRLEEVSERLEAEAPLNLRTALQRAKEDVARLLRLVAQRDANLLQAAREKDATDRNHDQAVSLADSVQGEVKRLEGVIDTLRTRQTMSSAVVENLTQERDKLSAELQAVRLERDGLNESLSAADERSARLETEMVGLKEVCSCQKEILQERYNELENLRRKVWLMENEEKTETRKAVSFASAQEGLEARPSNLDISAQKSNPSITVGETHLVREKPATQKLSPHRIPVQSSPVANPLYANPPPILGLPGGVTKSGEPPEKGLDLQPTGRVPETALNPRAADKSVSKKTDLSVWAKVSEDEKKTVDQNASSTIGRARDPNSRPGPIYSGSLCTGLKRLHSTSLPNSRSVSPSNHAQQARAAASRSSTPTSRPVTPTTRSGTPSGANKSVMRTRTACTSDQSRKSQMSPFSSPRFVGPGPMMAPNFPVSMWGRIY